MVNGIHHVNFLVRDLDEAVGRYRALLGLGEPVLDTLPGRGVLTARFRLGPSWLVLVQPVDPEGEPARHLAEHGEGFFLLSLGVDDLDAAAARVDTAGGRLDGPPRVGLEGWQVRDLDPALTFGARLQLCRDPLSRDA
jgi:methylmalonyl-CoA/ethylmalonyl-CoA epimerase